MNEYQPDSEQPLIPPTTCGATTNLDILIALAEVMRDVYIATMNEGKISQLTDRVQ